MITFWDGRGLVDVKCSCLSSHFSIQPTIRRKSLLEIFSSTDPASLQIQTSNFGWYVCVKPLFLLFETHRSQE
jgi:hypothetical protein